MPPAKKKTQKKKETDFLRMRREVEEARKPRK